MRSDSFKSKQMKSIQHLACKTDILLKSDNNQAALWCPACRRFVTREETNAKGSLAVVR